VDGRLANLVPDEDWKAKRNGAYAIREAQDEEEVKRHMWEGSEGGTRTEEWFLSQKDHQKRRQERKVKQEQTRQMLKEVEQLDVQLWHGTRYGLTRKLPTKELSGEADILRAARILFRNFVSTDATLYWDERSTSKRSNRLR
jgi:hypothetical protein